MVKSGRYTGLAGVAAAVVILVQTPFIVATWNYSGVGTDWTRTPLLARLVGPTLESAGLLTFASGTSAYYFYGRLFVLTYLLVLPVVISRRRLLPSNAVATVGYWLLLGGLVFALLGDVLAYWGGSGAFSRIQQAGFVVEILALLVVLAGSSILGAGFLRDGNDRGLGWAFVLSGPAGLALSVFVVAYIPNGPMLPVTLAWALVGVPFLKRDV